MSVIRGTSLTGFRELVTECGGDPDALLRGAGIRPEDVGRFDAFFTYPAMMYAMESAAAATATPDFGLRLGTRQGIDILGPVGVAARTAPTVADALRTFEHYLAAYSPAIGVHVEPLPGDQLAFFEFAVLIAHPPAHPQTIDLSLGVALQVFRFMLGSHYAPTVVHLPHGPLISRAEYLRYFSCTTRFDEPRAGFTLPAADLERPLIQDDQAHRAVLTYLDTVIDRTDRTLRTSIRKLVRQLLPTGAATLPVIAAQFRLHPKSLQRRLAAEGTSFAALVDDVRREMTERYLRDTEVTLAHLARELGYAEQSVLTRSCRRWFGASPAALRNRWQSEPASAMPMQTWSGS
ncbi:AraC family transcriptional regulator [Nocardia alba]|uniref:AraC family transcriptional regulator n=1 Tax=Nocardia alba TaxID=225051 RepID=A0A4V2PAI1_9NOCA|nr:AraC family transcriptional regulator [Nocardia alba]TCJ93575.1 AraC family transcriptional regulator [Nocardia alba]